MKWRNEQIYHLRQTRPLTDEDQEKYFRNVVPELFEATNPDQILFSYLENDECIGYGGLVHINWFDKNAEISFIIDTALEQKNFYKHWGIYLSLIEDVAFKELGLHKIYTYAFDLRPHLYEAIEAADYNREAILKEHCYINGEYIDVVIHTKINSYVSVRVANEADLDIVYKWTNDISTRENSFSSEPISLESHIKWWKAKMDDTCAVYFIAEIKSEPAGIVRFDKSGNDDRSVIGINIAPEFRGKGWSYHILTTACKSFFRTNSTPVEAYIKKTNTPSIKLFEKAGFRLSKETKIDGIEAFVYELSKL